MRRSSRVGYMVVVIAVTGLAVVAVPAHADSGQHLAGVVKTAGYTGGFGTQFKIQVRNPSSIDIGEWVRVRAAIRDPATNSPFAEIGWTEVHTDPTGPTEVPKVYTEGPNGTLYFPGYNLNPGSSYMFKVQEVSGCPGLCTRAYIFWNDAWRILKDWNDAPGCPCYEKAGLYVLGSGSGHPQLNGGIELAQGNILQGDGDWVQWNPTNYPHSGTEDAPDPYDVCALDEWHHFFVRQGGC
jgi:hypothetical protein